MEPALLATAARLVSTGPGQLAGERNCDPDERHAIHGFRFGNDFSVQGSAPEISGFFSNRPNLVAGQDPNAGPQTTSAWLNPRCVPAELLRTPTLRCSNSARPAVTLRRGRDTPTGTSRLFKNIRVTESKEFQFRAEFFNILNHTNFRLPDSDINSPTFNQILAAQAAAVDPVGAEIQLLSGGRLRSDARSPTPAIRSAGLRWDQAGPPCGQDRSRRRFRPPWRKVPRRKLQWEKPARAIPGSA